MSILPHLADPVTLPPPLATAGAGALLLIAVAVDWTAPARIRPTRVDAVRDVLVALAVTAGVSSLAAGPTRWLWAATGAAVARPAGDPDHTTAVTAAAIAVVLVAAAAVFAGTALTPTLRRRTGEPTGPAGVWARTRSHRSCPATSWPLWLCAAAPALLAGVIPGPAGFVVRALVLADQAVWSLPFRLASVRDRSGVLPWSLLVAAVWLISIGWRPHHALIPSPGTWTRWRYYAKCLVSRDSDSDSDSTTGRDRLRPVVRSDGSLWLIGQHGGHLVRGTDRTQPAGWLRRQWAGARPVATAGDVPARTPTRTDLQRWIRRQLAAGKATTDIVRRGTSVLGGGRSEATMWREVRRVRAERAA